MTLTKEYLGIIFNIWMKFIELKFADMMNFIFI